MSVSEVDILEQRLSKIERRVFGTSDIAVGGKHAQCVESLLLFHNQLQSALSGRERIGSVLKKMDDIEKYTDPEYADRLTLSESAKRELILADEDRIRWTVDHLQKVDDLKSFLDSEHIRSAPMLFPKLRSLCEVQIEQESYTMRLSDEVKSLLEAYNSLIRTITKQFILWDEILTKIEMEKNPPITTYQM